MPGRPDVVIGTARPADIDYPLGGSICRLFNLDTQRHGLRCAEEPSGGSVANIESLRSEIAGLRSSVESIDAKATRAEADAQRAAADAAQAEAAANAASLKADQIFRACLRK